MKSQKQNHFFQTMKMVPVAVADTPAELEPYKPAELTGEIQVVDHIVRKSQGFPTRVIPKIFRQPPPNRQILER